MIVVDASALIEYLLRTPAATDVAARLFDTGETLHAPHLLDVEVAQVIRRLAALRTIGQSDGRAALSDLPDLPIRRYPHGPFIPRVWQLRENLSAYDALYVALAESLDATLLTCDRRLARASSNHVKVDLTASSRP